MIKKLSDFIIINENIASMHLLEEFELELNSIVEWVELNDSYYIIFNEQFVSNKIESRSFLNYKLYQMVTNIMGLNGSLYKFVNFIDYGYFIFNLSQSLTFESIFEKNFKRCLNLIINLNCSKLDISFFNNSYSVSLNKGASILFPSNFMFDYIIDGNGYIMFTTLDFK